MTNKPSTNEAIFETVDLMLKTDHWLAPDIRLIVKLLMEHCKINNLRLKALEEQCLRFEAELKALKSK